MDNVTIFAALGAGIASFITPCVLPLVPVYLATLAGPQILDEDADERGRLPLFLHSLFFVLGFTVVFTIVGAIAGLIGKNIDASSPTVRVISGGLLVFFGLFMWGSQYIPALGFERRLTPAVGDKVSYMRSFIIGGAFTVAWTPCLSTILGTILTLAVTSETAWRGAGLLAVYSLGLGIPFLLLGAFFGTLLPIIRKVGALSRYIYLAGGLLLIVIGVFIILDKISLLMSVKGIAILLLSVIFIFSIGIAIKNYWTNRR